MKFYTYWRSSAAYRVRIALNFKGLKPEHIPIDLIRDGGEQHGEAFRAVNPVGTVPTLVLDDGTAITQSLAIIEYLEEIHPEPPLLPPRPTERARVRAAAALVACEIHPLNNLRITHYLKERFGHNQDEMIAWIRHWMQDGLGAFQKQIEPNTPFCFGDRPTLADLYLVPQFYNARRWGMDLTGSERLIEIETNCLALAEFASATPEAQPDAETR